MSAWSTALGDVAVGGGAAGWRRSRARPAAARPGRARRSRRPRGRRRRGRSGASLSARWPLGSRPAVELGAAGGDEDAAGEEEDARRARRSPRTSRSRRRPRRRASTASSAAQRSRCGPRGAPGREAGPEQRPDQRQDEQAAEQRPARRRPQVERVGVVHRLLDRAQLLPGELVGAGAVPSTGSSPKASIATRQKSSRPAPERSAEVLLGLARELDVGAGELVPGAAADRDRGADRHQRAPTTATPLQQRPGCARAPPRGRSARPCGPRAAAAPAKSASASAMPASRISSTVMPLVDGRLRGDVVGEAAPRLHGEHRRQRARAPPIASVASSQRRSRESASRQPTATSSASRPPRE